MPAVDSFVTHNSKASPGSCVTCTRLGLETGVGVADSLCTEVISALQRTDPGLGKLMINPATKHGQSNQSKAFRQAAGTCLAAQQTADIAAH